ncbi:hypothetical protein [Streptomyces sp. NBC_01264]|uniref:hypothetical protein n=1 Tax=Streptomyces sp. NBC_01264 TaxID=2903804 RepID=UPI00224D9129|nr:hypothetical protein [Streptomyces sp. NBC_01264]MCX4783666.1 hypothetical protein [Streptomyces sp. NBC_01264]
MITMRLAGPGQATSAPADGLRDLLAVHFAPTDRIEHLWAGTGPDGIDLVFFVLAGCEAEALLLAHAACRRALHHTPQLAAWRMPDYGNGERHLPR